MIQLELTYALDQHVRENRCGSNSADLLTRLRNVAYEMQQYGNSNTEDSAAKICMYKFKITCQC